MITAERLKELIEKEATIYITSGIETDLKKIEIEFGRNRLTIINRQENIYNYWDYEDLFETKSEAEFYAKFGHMERVEKLSLPSWEEFLKTIEVKFQKDFYLYFVDKKCNKISITCLYPENFKEWKQNILFEKPLTEENYNEACELVKKLFQGE